MSNENTSSKVCPYCGGTEFVIGIQGGYAAVNTEKFSFRGQTLYHEICENCGTVIRSFIYCPLLQIILLFAIAAVQRKA